MNISLSFIQPRKVLRVLTARARGLRNLNLNQIDIEEAAPRANEKNLLKEVSILRYKLPDCFMDCSTGTINSRALLVSYVNQISFFEIATCLLISTI